MKYMSYWEYFGDFECMTILKLEKVEDAILEDANSII